MWGKALRSFGLAVVALGLLAISASAQDFQKSYRLAPGSSVQISNISGDVVVTGYDGDAIIVTGTKEGENLDVVTIEDRSTPNTVDVGVHYPNNCRHCNASVQFQVQVPRSMNYNLDRIRSVSGDIRVTGATGRLDASTVSGNVTVSDFAGPVSAKSVSGDVDAEITRLESSGDMTFNTVSGNVNVKVPQNLDAQVELASFSGSIDTNLPLQIEKARYTSSQKATGQLGSGSRRLNMHTVSGNVSLRTL
ncbi:MAG TPA: DUF4097 family beta strand repeat-containing protein [Blastocatellia bacterium]|nr:DUF4097 family beta strand repeat-containing protein [Blastocatellia bacterium]